MGTTNVKTRSGNRTDVLIDGKKVGLIQSVRMSDDYGLEPASGIGDIHVQEHVPSMARHMLSVSTMVLLRKNLKQLNIAPENGDAALKGLVFDFLTIDKASGEVLKKYIGCSYASGDSDVSKHTIVMLSATFQALDVQGLGL